MGKQDMIYTLDGDMRKKLMTHRKTGLQKGMWMGWPELHELYSAKKGSTTYIVAPPAVGKTAIINEFVINLAEFEDCKIVIFTPETGSPMEVFNELLWAKLREPFVKHDRSTVTDKMAKDAMDWVEKHFYILDPMEFDLTARDYFRAIRELEEGSNIKIDVAVIDPITDMDIYSDEGARDLALGGFLSKVRKFSGAYEIHTFVAFHTKRVPPENGKDIDGKTKRYVPEPTMADVAGGEMAGRKGMFILGLWRPPVNMIDLETEEPYPRNESRVEILKAKPKAIGRQGVFKLYYDYYSTRFYTLNEDSNEAVWSSPKPPGHE